SAPISTWQDLPGGSARCGRRCAIPSAGFKAPGAPPTLPAVAVSEEQLAQDLTAAMKARDAQRVAVLRGVVAAAKLLKVERRAPRPEEADLVQVLRKEVRKREEAEEFAIKAGREDLVSQNRAERAILDEYVPPHRAGGRCG